MSSVVNRGGVEPVVLVAGGPGEGRSVLLARAARDFAGTSYVVGAPRRQVPWSAARALLDALTPSAAAAGRATRLARGPGGIAAALAAVCPPGRGPFLLCLDDFPLWDAHSRAAFTAHWRTPVPGGTSRVGWLVACAPGRPLPTADAPVVRLPRLDRASARALLADARGGRVGPAVVERLLDEADGHPGVLVESVRRLAPGVLAGGAPGAGPLVDDGVVEAVYGGLLGALPADGRRLLGVVARACGTPDAAGGAGGDRGRTDVGTVLARARALRVPTEALDGLVAAGLLHRHGDALVFPDPFLRRAAARHGTRPTERDRRRGAGPTPVHGPLLHDGHPVVATGREACGEGAPAPEGDRSHDGDRVVGRGPRRDDTPVPERDPRHGGDRVPDQEPRGGDAPVPEGDPRPEGAPRPGRDPRQDLGPSPHHGPRHPENPPPGPGRHDENPPAGPGPRHQEDHPAPAHSRHHQNPAPGRGPRHDGDPAPGRGSSGLPDPHERHRADRLGPPAAVRARSAAARGRALLTRGFAALARGPVMDAHESFLLAAKALRDREPAEAADARFLAMEAGWAAGDVAACLAALDLTPAVPGPERAFAEGLRAAILVRPDRARAALASVVAAGGVRDEPRLLLRAGSAALVLGDVTAAVRLHGRALVRARAEERASLLPRILEHLAYAELRAGRYTRAAHAAGDGLRAARATGQLNSAAHQHAVLALVASVKGDEPSVGEHAQRALAIGRPHGLAQAVTLAEWALARAELGAGLPDQAAARLAPLVRTGPSGGHFALRMLAVPCFVEAAVTSGRVAEAREATEQYAQWAAFGLDRPAPAQLARCRALLARQGEETSRWFGEALRRHDDGANDFERARTLFAYGTWLRRRRRPGEARGPLRDALVTFERAAADGWARQARAELRATGAPGTRRPDPSALAGLTPQQRRIARLVADGATNEEVATRLSLSPRTVDHHLRGVYARLQLRSRVELSVLMAAAEG
ncbi:LuxR C-terminal-related transcriptional regulator [Streptomyces roseolus]|uniref:helix-turn-helix transcriptional regulator n=1 Tax=Streptomyces roseolus TaxID=67358 RepID=UPI0036EF4C70